MNNLLHYWPWAIIVLCLCLIILSYRSRSIAVRQSSQSIETPRKGINLFPHRTERRLARLSHNQIMVSIVSLSVLACALYIVLSNSYSNAEQKWAFGAIGTIMGFWLKPDK